MPKRRKTVSKAELSRRLSRVSGRKPRRPNRPQQLFRVDWMTYVIKGYQPNLDLHYCLPNGAWVKATFSPNSDFIAHEAAFRIAHALKDARSLMAAILYQNDKPMTLVTEPAP